MEGQSGSTSEREVSLLEVLGEKREKKRNIEEVGTYFDVGNS